MDKKSILITGGCGYIGSHAVIEFLRQTDYNIISVDNFVNSSPDTLDRVEKITGVKIKNYKLDLRDYNSIVKIFKETPSIISIVHFAALKSVPESVANPERYYDNNINSLINIIRCCKEFNINNFIFSSSCSVYGNVELLPVNELTPLSQVESPYAHTKQIGEDIIKQCIKNTNIKAILLRYFNPVGADITGLNGELANGRPDNLFPFITQVAAGILEKLVVFGVDYDTRDGSCVRDYVHVTDIANAHIKAFQYIENGGMKNSSEIINLGTGRGITVLEAIATFEKTSGVKLNWNASSRRNGDVASIYSDCTKAEQLLNWKALYGIEEMIKTAWKWQQQIKG